MTRNHLKARAAPRTWNIARKANTFVMRPNAGSQTMEMTLPLALIMRELKVGSTQKELNYILKNTPVLVNGVRRWDLRFGVGFQDVFSIPEQKVFAVLSMDSKGRLMAETIDEKQTSHKLARVRGTSMVKGGKLQLQLTDGRTLFAESKAAKVAMGSTVSISIPKAAISAVYPVEPKAHVILTSGKHRGKRGAIKTIEGDVVTVITEGGDITTKTSYAFVLGGNK